MTFFEKLDFVIVNLLCSQSELAKRANTNNMTIYNLFYRKTKKPSKSIKMRLEKVLDEIIKEKGIK